MTIPLALVLLAAPVDTRWEVRVDLTYQSPVMIFPQNEVEHGLLLGGNVRRALGSSWAVGARVAPIGLGFAPRFPSRAGSRATGIFTALGWVYGEWRSRWLALSLGAGGSTVNAPFDRDGGVGAFVPALGVRIGSARGLRLEGAGGLQLFEGGAQWGFADGELHVPVSRRLGFFLHGMTSNAGVTLVELGARFPLPGSDRVAVRTTGGVGRMVWAPPRIDPRVAEAIRFSGRGDSDLVGLTFGLGLEWALPDGGAR